MKKMKNLLFMLLAVFAVSVSADAANYRNVFVEMGYQPQRRRYLYFPDGN